MKKVLIQIHILWQGDSHVPFIHMYIATHNCKLKPVPGQMSPIFNLTNIYFDSNKITQCIKLKINKPAQCPVIRLMLYGPSDLQVLAKRIGIVGSKYFMG